MSQTLSLFTKAGLVGLSLAALAGCATPAPYAPRQAGQDTGYTDRQLAANRYRITFTGNSVTPRELVEDDLLRRAAEVTLAAGYTHFLFDSRDTQTDRRVEAIGDPEFDGGFSRYGGGLGPYAGGDFWRFHPRWGYGAFGPDVDIVTLTRYAAYAEIVLLNDDQAKHEVRAVDARQVIDHLMPPPPPGTPPVTAPAPPQG